MRAARGDPGKLKAGTLALLVHAAFFTLLVFGVTWKSQQPAGVQAELWTSLPSGPTPPVVEKPAPPPEPPKQVQPEPKPKAEPKPDPQVDIALRQEKLRKERQEKARLDEEKRKKEAEKKRKEEQALEEKQEREKAQKLAEQKAKAEKEAQAKAAGAAAQARTNEYLDRIKSKIRQNTILPPELVGNPEVQYRVTLLPTGEILDLQLVQSSGFPSYDQATERAIRKSSPLPVPKDDPALFQRDFRSAIYRFRPNE